MRNLQEQVKKAFCYQKLYWPFTVWINCSSGLKNFANSRPSASNFKTFSWSLEQLFLTVGQNNFDNKIPILFYKNGSLHNFYIMTLPERLSIFGCIVNFFQNANVQSQNWDVGYGFNNYDFHPSQINRNISWVVSECGCYDWGFIGKHWMVSFQFQKPVKYKQKIIGKYLSSFKWHTVILEYFNIKEYALSNFAFQSF